jgi:hypothetical protein
MLWRVMVIVMVVVMVMVITKEIAEVGLSRVETSAVLIGWKVVER